MLQHRYEGRSTNWDSVLGDIHDVQSLLEGWAGDRAHLASLLAEEHGALRARELAQKLEQASASVQGLIETGLAASLAQQVQDDQITLPSLDELVQDALPITERIERAASIPLVNARQSIPDLLALCQLISSGARLVALELEHSQKRDALQADFGVRFMGFDTDWPDILECLTWTGQLLEMVPSGRLSRELLAHAEQPQPSVVYVGIADKAADALQQLRAQVEPLMGSYDLESSLTDRKGQASFDDVKRWSEELSRDADSASDWLLYRAAVSELDRSIGASTVDRIRQQNDESGLVPRIIERRVLGAWLDWIYQQEPALASFTAAEQQDLILRFRELDERLPMAAQHEVRKRVLEKYPSAYSTYKRAGEFGILRHELSKSRSRWPVRRLLRTVPLLIQTLKPCFLTSPLAVSQYLPLSTVASETLAFDVVIFDEASQVFPEDAVPAILRGKQAIIAGDQKQLPPSSFFRHSLAEDEPHEEEDDADATEPNQLMGMESILGAAVGLVGRLFKEEHLNVHYRSRDESLIRFSNHHFYDDRLVTFPSPGIRDLWLGVHDVYVPDGRYDAGATRTNRKEAERVVELVFEHMRTRPVGESLGVVALSRTQADLIERLVDERRILERDVNERFNERPDEPFFVKNLERVQGDERDHMIISIGYGPTAGSGAVPNRFGPLNIAGGERRLNVVVTRARQRVDILHSLRASDIHSQQEGARFLRRYLEYAANPQQAFEAQVTGHGSETESPFEAAVERALVAKGYRVAMQVGVAGYRIDLAILSEDGTKYDLGIECDGQTWHNAPAARDRDWLRQQVLEGLGWSIHRVWSTAWIRNPAAELARIIAALTAARAQSTFTMNRETAKVSYANPTGADPEIVEIAPPSTPEIQLQDYEEAELPKRPQWAKLRSETTDTLVGMVTQVAKVEGPVHKDVVIERIRQCYGLGRVRGSTRENVERVIQVAQSRGTVRGDGTFIWVENDQLSRAPRGPVDGNIEHIPLSELRKVVVATARVMFGVSRHDLINEVARKLGNKKTGGRILEVLDRVVQEMLNQGQLVERFSMIHFTEQ
jgi:very-short-patch-repair endonuclease